MNDTFVLSFIEETVSGCKWEYVGDGICNNLYGNGHSYYTTIQAVLYEDFFGYTLEVAFTGPFNTFVLVWFKAFGMSRPDCNAWSLLSLNRSGQPAQECDDFSGSVTVTA